MSAVVGILVTVTVAAGANNDRSPSPRGHTIRLENAVVLPADEVEVPAQEAGVLTLVNVQLGDMVRSGQRCARIGDDVARIEQKIAEIRVKQAEIEAENSLDTRYARAVASVAHVEHEQALTIDNNVPGAMGESEIRRRALSRQRADMAVEQAEMEKELAAITHRARTAELRLTEARLRLREISAPIDGIVVDVYKRRGEWVNPGDSVLRIIRIDQLRVQAYVKLNEYSPHQLRNRSVEVVLTHDLGRTTRLKGAIVFCSPELETGREFRVQANITNTLHQGQWSVHPGQLVELVTTVDAQAPERADDGQYAASRRRP